MPQLNAGQTYTAKASMTNPTGSSFSYNAELYLGLPKVATSGMRSFTLAPGEVKTVSFPVTMPESKGTYPVYLDVFVGTELIAAFVSDSVTTVILPEIVVGPVIWE